MTHRRRLIEGGVTGHGVFPSLIIGERKKEEEEEKDLSFRFGF